MKKKAVLFFLTIIFAASVSGIHARHYASQQARFTSPDPISITENRIVDPQQLNLYSYARTNPLRFVDPQGLDITVTGNQQDQYMKDLQAGIQSFQVKMNASGVVEIDGEIPPDWAMSGSDKELYTAITDTEHHATIVTCSGNPDVDFGGFWGGGTNAIDFQDVNLLDSPRNAGGMTSAQVVGHETLEAYGASQGQSLNDAHQYAQSNFGSLGNPLAAGARVMGRANPTNPSLNLIVQLYAEHPVMNTLGVASGVREGVTRQLAPPITVSAIPAPGTHVPAHIIDVVRR